MPCLIVASWKHRNISWSIYLLSYHFVSWNLNTWINYASLDSFRYLDSLTYCWKVALRKGYHNLWVIAALNIVDCHLAHPIVIILLLFSSLDIVFGYFDFQLLTTTQGLLVDNLLNNLHFIGWRWVWNTSSVYFKVFHLNPIQLLIQILFQLTGHNTSLLMMSINTVSSRWGPVLHKNSAMNTFNAASRNDIALFQSLCSHHVPLDLLSRSNVAIRIRLVVKKLIWIVAESESHCLIKVVKGSFRKAFNHHVLIVTWTYTTRKPVIWLYVPKIAIS